MSVSRFAAHRPIFTIMATLVVVILGFIALIRLPVDLMPDISLPTLSVSTSYGNSSPEIVEQLITRPIEEAMSTVPGVEEISSSSSEGSSSVRLSFAWGTDLEAAAADVRDRLDRVLPRLPDDADRPRLFKFDPNSFPVMTIGAFGDLDPQVLRRIVDEQVLYRLERIPGVAAVDVWGGVQREIHVDFLPERLQSLGIPVDQILSRIRANNIETPVGSVSRGSYRANVRASGLYASLDDLRNTIVAERDGVPVRLGQIAAVEDGRQEQTRIARINGKPGIRLSINKQSGRNTVEVAGGVRREIERLNLDLPRVQLVVLNDTSDYIRYSIGNVGTSALYGGLIALLVLLFFLRSVRSTAVIAASIPISIVATFALMYFSRFTLNIMTLGGLALGIGMLVDNSIVVLENIYRYRESGEPPLAAAVKGSEEVGTAITASTLTTLVVFLPLIFTRGLAGVMYRQLSLVVAFALLCSLAAALTVVPMLSARLLRRRAGGPSSPTRWSAAAFDRFARGYERLLRLALDHRGRVFAGVAALFLGSLLLIPLVAGELMPATDQGQVRVSVEMEQGTRLEIVDAKFRAEVEPIVQAAVPEAASIISNVGGGFGPQGGSGSVSINLKPRRERVRSDEQIAQDLSRRLAAVPGVQVRTRTGQGFFLLRGGSINSERVQIEIRGHDLAVADGLAERVREAVSGVAGVTDVRLSREPGNLEEHLLIDRSRAADLGVTPQQVAAALQSVVSGSQAGSYREGGSEYPIVVRLQDAESMSLEQVLSLPILNAEGRAVPLDSLVRVRPQKAPGRIERLDQERVVTVYANTGGRQMGQVIADVRQRIRSIPVPRDFSILITGDYEEQQEANRELALSVVLALLLVFMVMACLYESLLDPLIVMLSVPLAVIGVMLMLVVTGTSFNVQAGIGALMLGGIVVNNAILLVDQTNLLRRRDGLPLREAVEQAARHRLRPILMTALTTIGGLIPLALGLGEGGEVQAPLARTVIGGLLSSTFITLLFIPALYYAIESRRERRSARRKGAPAPVSRLAFLPVALPALLLLLLAPSRPAAAEQAASGGPLRLTLRESILMALENNASLRVLRLAPVIRRTFEREQQGAFQPTVEAGISTSQDPQTIAGGLEPEVAGNAGASLFLPSGTTLEAAALAGQGVGGFSAGVDVSVTQSILRGGGPEANLALVRQARIDTSISEQELRAFTESLVAGVEQTYWDLYLAERQVEIFRESLQLAEQHLQETRERIEVGSLAEIELPAAQVEVALRREALLDAEAGRERARLQLLRLINPRGGLGWDTPIVPADRPEEPEERLDEVAAHVELGRRLRPDLNQARLQVQRGDLEVVRTRGGLLPRLDFSLSFGMADGGALPSPAGGVAGFQSELAAGLSFSWPVGNEAAQARHERAQATRRQLDEALRNLEQQVEVEIRSAYLEVNRTREQIRATATTQALQEERLRAETEKFRVGRSTTYLVAQAQRDLLSSRLAQAQAVVSHLAALISLYRLEGSLLERRGLAVPSSASPKPGNPGLGG